MSFRITLSWDSVIVTLESIDIPVCLQQYLALNACEKLLSSLLSIVQNSGATFLQTDVWGLAFKPFF